MTPEELRQILRQPESESLEFKRALPSAQQLASNVAALANTQGGLLVLGADERDPEHGGLAHPGVAADHVRQWIEQMVTPVPNYSTEVVSLEPGRNYAVIRVEPGAERPYLSDGRALERRGDRLVPITPERITEGVRATTPEDRAPLERMAVALSTLSATVERLEAQLHWKHQLPLQLAIGIGAVLVGYLLGIWNPLG